MKIKENGKIINIASIAANRVRDGRTAYSTSKAGLIAFTKVIALELAKYNILCKYCCNSIYNIYNFIRGSLTK